MAVYFKLIKCYPNIGKIDDTLMIFHDWLQLPVITGSRRPYQ